MNLKNSRNYRTRLAFDGCIIVNIKHGINFNNSERLPFSNVNIIVINSDVNKFNGT